ncbi:MAG: hypothetical protein LUC96_00435 [Alistipes sp.]|uniref:hypothetical protein n=1 Tax=Alistipes sp. TaxID=1872444 RepID=UPI0025C6D279|nr:hypothetical protein [Alistipes sp.]MCD8273445.1 hypothetical protein [Alistipes sp.]
MTICKERIRGTKVEKFSRSAITVSEHPIYKTGFCFIRDAFRYFGAAWNMCMLRERGSAGGETPPERRKERRRGNALWVNRFCNSVISRGFVLKN